MLRSVIGGINSFLALQQLGLTDGLLGGRFHKVFRNRSIIFPSPGACTDILNMSITIGLVGSPIFPGVCQILVLVWSNYNPLWSIVT